MKSNYLEDYVMLGWVSGSSKKFKHVVLAYTENTNDQGDKYTTPTILVCGKDLSSKKTSMRFGRGSEIDCSICRLAVTRLYSGARPRIKRPTKKRGR